MSDVEALAEWLYERSGGIFWRGETTWQDRHREEARQWFAYADLLTQAAPPTCAWCSSPAAEQVYVGTHYHQQQPSRRYAWLCGPCANHIEHEVNHD